MASLISVGRGYKGQAHTGMMNTLQRQDRRDQFNQGVKDAEKAELVTGAASGAAIGTQILPGWGTALGAAIGGLSSLIF